MATATACHGPANRLSMGGVLPLQWTLDGGVQKVAVCLCLTYGLLLCTTVISRMLIQEPAGYSQLSVCVRHMPQQNAETHHAEAMHGLQGAHSPEHSHALPAPPASLPGCKCMQVENVELIRAYGRMLKLVLMRGKLLQQLKSAIAALQKAADNQSSVPVALEHACHDIKKKVAEVDEDITVRQDSAECGVVSFNNHDTP